MSGESLAVKDSTLAQKASFYANDAKPMSPAEHHDYGSNFINLPYSEVDPDGTLPDREVVFIILRNRPNWTNYDVSTCKSDFERVRRSRCTSTRQSSQLLFSEDITELIENFRNYLLRKI